MSLPYNFYEELKLSCLNNKLTEKDIIAAVEKYIVEIKKSYNTSSDKASLQAKLNLESQMRDFASDKSLQKKHRDDLTEKRKAQIKKLVQMLKAQEAEDSPTVLQARINTLAAHFDLEREAVKQAFVEGRYKVDPGVKRATAELFIADNILAEIETNLAKIRAACASEIEKQKKVPNTVRHLPDGLLDVANLYEYLAAQKGGKAKDYAKSGLAGPGGLKTLFDALVKTPDRNNNQEPFVFYKNLEALALSHIFSGELEKKKYDNSLRLASLRAEVLDFVRELPEQLKHDRGFAENIIRKIQGSFPDEDEAIAIYNKFSGLKNDQFYEKEVPETRVVCRCGRLNIHKSLEQARKAKCVNCGEELFRVCPSCSKFVFNASDYCSCGYHIPDAAEFVKFRNLCAEALKRKEIDAAKKALDEARRFKPEKSDLSSLEREVNTLLGEIHDETAAIEERINKKFLDEAREKLGAMRRKYPSMSFAALEKKLDEAQNAAREQLGKADKDYQKILLLPDLKSKVTALAQLLRNCPDHEPSRNLLLGAELRPLAPLNVIAEANHREKAISVAWQPNPGDVSVVYRLVRNEGGNPSNPGDGMVLAENLQTVNFVDRNVKAGARYHYAVFACHRVGDLVPENFSPPAVSKSSAFLMPGLDGEKISYELDGTSCILRWQDMPGSQGVRIERARNGEERKKICDCATGSFVDKNLVVGARYMYEFATIWQDGSGKACLGPVISRREVIVSPRPEPYSPQKMDQERQDGICQIGWQREQDALGDVIIFKLKSPDIMRGGQEYDVELLPGMGQRLGAARANAGSATINIGPNAGAHIVLLRQFGNKVIPGAVLSLSSLASVEATGISINNEEGTLRMTCRGGANVVSYQISVTPRNGKPIVWRYNRAGGDSTEIVCENVPQGELELEITARTADGFSTPPARYKLRNIKRTKARYSLKWKKQFGLFGAVSELEVAGRVEGAGLSDHKLYLCSAPSFHGADMRYYNEGKMKKLAEILPDEEGGFNGILDSAVLSRLSSGERVSLVPDRNDVEIFEITCDTPKEMKSPI